MKKITILFLLLFLMVSNFFFYEYSKEKQSEDVLYKNSYIYNIDYHDNLNEKKILKDIEYFSSEQQVSIFQFIHTSEKKLDMYSFNSQFNPNIKILSGESPYKSKYITSSKPDNNSNGYFFYPNNEQKVIIHDWEFSNVRFSTQIYMTSENYNKSFYKLLRKYGDVSVEKYQFISPLWNIKVLLALFLSLVIISISIFYCVMLLKKKIYILFLFGKRSNQIIITITKDIFKAYWLISLLILLFSFIYISITHNFVFVTRYLFLISFLNLLIYIFLVVLTAFFTKLFISGYKSGIVNKNKFYVLSNIIVVFKIGLFSLVLVLSLSSFKAYSSLEEQTKTLSLWEKTQNTYRFIVGLSNKEFDLGIDKRENDRFYKLYEDIKNKYPVFLIDSNNFHRENNNEYDYKQSIKNIDDIYSDHGYSIMIDENYLKYNSIVDTENKNILKKIHHDKDVLNVIVPIKLKDKEKIIIDNYSEWFNFNRYEVSNMYNEYLKLPFISNKDSNLKINIIYSKTNQSYFTFNSATGDNKNNVIDPIALIYNNSVDSSVIGAATTSSIYIQDTPFVLSGSLKKHEVSNIARFDSVYDEKHKEINSLTSEIKKNIIIISALFSTYIFLIIIQNQIYYRVNFYKINLKILFGNSYIKILIRKLTSLTLINFLIILILTLLTNSIPLISIGLLITLIEFIVALLTIQFLGEKDLSIFIKGEEL